MKGKKHRGVDAESKGWYLEKGERQKNNEGSGGTSYTEVVCVRLTYFEIVHC